MNNENINNTINTKDELTKILLQFALEHLENPFKALTVKDVAKDLNIGKNAAYSLFRRDDFPSINIGQAWHISQLSYIAWKLSRRV